MVLPDDCRQMNRLILFNSIQSAKQQPTNQRISVSIHSPTYLINIGISSNNLINSNNINSNIMTYTSRTSMIPVSNILMIGATGRMGVELIDAISTHTAANHSNDVNNVNIHAFCRSPQKLQPSTKDKCASVIKGDARSPSDLRHAIQQSKADLVLVAVGNGDDVSKSDIREANAKALVAALNSDNNDNNHDDDNNHDMSKVRVFVVSSNGAGPTKIKVGFGIGMMIQYHLRHVMKDHTRQENVFLTQMKDRVGFVRPTALTDGKPTGATKTFGDHDKPPTIQTDRSDLAKWVVAKTVLSAAPASGSDHGGRMVMDESAFGGRAFNITCVKK
mmetsp:Transcript_26901/g.75617  ORF Transcript_26901/g.75617 Transcript_26901/m.75617 type:complete len:332 (-) Transcript_26901:190-1185(-)